MVIQGRSRIKVWIVVWRCLSYGCIALDYVLHYNTENFLEALERQCKRHKVPEKIFSDQATYFTGAQKHVEKVYPMTTWHFAIPKAPHMSGAVERIVGLAKKAIKFLCKGEVNYDKLRTILATAEHHLNLRPLGFIGDDPHEPIVMTPRHFLVEKAADLLPAFSFGGGNPLLESLAAKNDQILKAVQLFKEEYHRSLVSFFEDYNTRNTPEQPNLKVGDVVAILLKNTTPDGKDSPLGEWPIGVVIDAVESPDDHIVREVTVRVRGTAERAPLTAKRKYVVDTKASASISAALGMSIEIPRVLPGGEYTRHVKYVMLLERVDKRNGVPLNWIDPNKPLPVLDMITSALTTVAAKTSAALAKVRSFATWTAAPVMEDKLEQIEEELLNVGHIVDGQVRAAVQYFTHQREVGNLTLCRADDPPDIGAAGVAPDSVVDHQDEVKNPVRVCSNSRQNRQ